MFCIPFPLHLLPWQAARPFKLAVAARPGDRRCHRYPRPGTWNLIPLTCSNCLGHTLCSRQNATHSHQFLCRLPQLQAICSSCVAPECKRHRPGAMPPNRNAQQDVRGQGHDVDLDEATFRVEIV